MSRFHKDPAEPNRPPFTERVTVPVVCGLIFIVMFPLVGAVYPVLADDTRMPAGQIRIDLDDPVYRDYPKRLDGRGYIDRISATEIVIEDSYYRLSSSVTFHTPRRRSAPVQWFEAGQYVGYLLDSNKEIKSVWLLRLNR